MKNNNLIVFSGRIGSGKTTLANILVNNYGYTKVSFADPIRKMLKALGLTDYDLQEGKNTPHPLLSGRTPRYAMQTLGTEWARDIMDKNFWANIWKEKIKKLVYKDKKPVVTDDCRFINESIIVYEMNGTSIKIERDCSVIDEHESEKEIDLIECEFIIDNNGLIIDAHNELCEIIGFQGASMRND